jgi:dethiobiotin synthetase
MRGFFVTGTDTGVGKTVVSAGLVWLLQQHGWRVAPVKPVAAGLDWIDGRWINGDVLRLREACALPLEEADIGPIQLRTACAPHIAAALEGLSIVPHALLDAVRRAAARADSVVVEGVGGWRVPLNDTWDSADLAAALGLPVVLVVGLRLGCLNHALLSADAIRARRLPLAGWVGNTLPPEMPWARENLAALRAHLAAPCLGLVPPLPDPGPRALTVHLNTTAVLDALAAMP